MTDLNRYIELRHAYNCGLLIGRNLRHFRYGLWVYGDEITLERLFSAKTLVSFAGHADRLLVNFVKTSAHAIEELGDLGELKFSDFVSELSADIVTHHKDIIRALCPYDGSVVPARSKWLSDAAPQRDYRALLDASRRLAMTAEQDLFKHHCYLTNSLLRPAADELDDVAKQFLLRAVERCDRPESFFQSDMEEAPSDD